MIFNIKKRIAQWRKDRVAEGLYQNYLEGDSVVKLGVHIRMIQRLIKKLNKMNMVTGLWLCDDSIAIQVKIWIKDDRLLVIPVDGSTSNCYFARIYTGAINKVSLLTLQEEKNLLSKGEPYVIGWIGQNYVYVPEPAPWKMNTLLTKPLPNCWGNPDQEVLYNYRGNGLLIQQMGDLNPVAYTHEELLRIFYLYHY